MKNNKIGEALKYYRKLNKWSVEDVAVRLEQDFGLKVAEKTIYGWESNQSHPTSDMFIFLCRLYHINNIGDAFTEGKKSSEFVITNEEKKIIEYYRKQPELQAVVQRVLDIPSMEDE